MENYAGSAAYTGDNSYAYLYWNDSGSYRTVYTKPQLKTAMVERIASWFPGKPREPVTRALCLCAYEDRQYILLTHMQSMRSAAASSYCRQTALLPFRPEMYRYKMNALIYYRFLAEDELPKGDSLEWDFSLPVPETAPPLNIPMGNRPAIIAFALAYMRGEAKPLYILAPQEEDFTTYAQRALMAIYNLLPVAVCAKVGFSLNPDSKDTLPNIGFCFVPEGSLQGCRLGDDDDALLSQYRNGLSKNLYDILTGNGGIDALYQSLEGNGDAAKLLRVKPSWYEEYIKISKLDESMLFGSSMANIELPMDAVTVCHSHFEDYTQERYKADIEICRRQLSSLTQTPNYAESCRNFWLATGRQLKAVGEFYGWTGDFYEFFDRHIELDWAGKPYAELLDHLEKNRDILDELFTPERIKMAVEDAENNLKAQKQDAASKEFKILKQEINKTGDFSSFCRAAQKSWQNMDYRNENQDEFLACLKERLREYPRERIPVGYNLTDFCAAAKPLLSVPNVCTAAEWAERLRPYWDEALEEGKTSYEIQRDMGDFLENADVTVRKELEEKLSAYAAEYNSRSRLTLREYFSALKDGKNWQENKHRQIWNNMSIMPDWRKYHAEFRAVCGYPLHEARAKNFPGVEWLEADLRALSKDIDLAAEIEDVRDLREFFDRVEEYNKTSKQLRYFLGGSTVPAALLQNMSDLFSGRTAEYQYRDNHSGKNSYRATHEEEGALILKLIERGKLRRDAVPVRYLRDKRVAKECRQGFNWKTAFLCAAGVIIGLVVIIFAQTLLGDKPSAEAPPSSSYELGPDEIFTPSDELGDGGLSPSDELGDGDILPSDSDEFDDGDMFPSDEIGDGDLSAPDGSGEGGLPLPERSDGDFSPIELEADLEY